MPHETVRCLSLNAHLALEACLIASGNQHMLNELIRLMYLSFFMWENGVGNSNIVQYEEAEAAMDRAVNNAEITGRWTLPVSDSHIMARILAVYDEQISTVSTKVYLETVHRLGRVLATDSPFSPVARLKERKSPSERILILDHANG